MGDLWLPRNNTSICLLAALIGDGGTFILRHTGLAPAGENRGFVQGEELGCPPMLGRPRLSYARRSSAIQPTGFGEFRDGTFRLAFEAIGSGEIAAEAGLYRSGVARLFEPDDRFVKIAGADVGHPGIVEGAHERDVAKLFSNVNRNARCAPFAL